MAKEKGDLNKLFEKYQPMIKKTGEQLSKALKIAEDDISKVYRSAQVHVEIQKKKIEREWLYHEIGKFVGEKLMNGTLVPEDLEKFRKRMLKINSDGEKMKKKLVQSGKGSKPSKKTVKKTAKPV
ncbi:MAG: hypothetical protein ABH883_08350 [Candidatus Omnitrophota bacterium]